METLQYEASKLAKKIKETGDEFLRMGARSIALGEFRTSIEELLKQSKLPDETYSLALSKIPTELLYNINPVRYREIAYQIAEYVMQ